MLWSGGLDSTYTLLRLLEETRDDVFSHHVVVDDGGAGHDRGVLERAAIERLRGRLTARARPFDHTASHVRFGVRGGTRGDVSTLAFMAAHAARGFGFTPFDRILLGVNADEDPGWAPDSAACALRRARVSGALRAAWGCDEVPFVYLWEPRPQKAHMAARLGPALAPGTVSCLRPLRDADGTVPSACGECRKCRSRAAWYAPVLSPTTEPGAAARTGHPFRHLVQSLSGTPAPAAAAAASGPPAP